MTRTADLIWCALTAPLVVPLAALLGIAIWLGDGRPVFFRQERVGLARRSFEILKFRTMRGEQVARIGSWLRRTGLDETAQWFNVLRGHMSWIGPRPLTPSDIQRLGWHRPHHDPRFCLPPGITGLAQLYAGVTSSWTRGVDRVYRRRRGGFLNARIVVLTALLCALGKSRGRSLLFPRVVKTREASKRRSPDSSRWTPSELASIPAREGHIGMNETPESSARQ